ncbi:MAG: hypothetical protein C0404_00805 [Verrucomicrobia bacterium]|nr:hypothetical protein [Verrucomicrobiota bacterium]
MRSSSANQQGRRRGGRVPVEFDSVNTGAKEGTEVAQVYVHDCASSVPRPVKELKEFSAAILKAGERRTVRLELDERALQFFSLDHKCWVAESGDFEVRIGASAADIRLTGRFRYA